MANKDKVTKKTEVKVGTLFGVSISVAVLFTFVLAFVIGVYTGIAVESELQSYKIDQYDEMKAEVKSLKDAQNEHYDMYVELQEEYEEYKDSNLCSTTFEEYETQIDRHTKETINMTLLILEESHKNDACVNYLRGSYQNNETFQKAYDRFLDSYYEMTEELELT